MTKNQIEYRLGQSQLAARYAELQHEQAKLEHEKRKYRDQMALDYGYIYDKSGNLVDYNPRIGYKTRQAEADIAAAYASANKALAEERYGGGAVGDIRRAIESMFPGLKDQYWQEEGGE